MKGYTYTTDSTYPLHTHTHTHIDTIITVAAVKSTATLVDGKVGG